MFGSECLVCQRDEKLKNCICRYCYEEILNMRNFGRKSGTFILFKYSGVIRFLILNGKYKFNRHVWDLWEDFFNNLEIGSDNLIVYVPTTFRRYCFRGFNQSYILAKALERQGYGKVCKLISRVKFKKSASLLSKADRYLEIKDNFSIKKGYEKFLDKNLLIVDDVITSGATMNEIEKCLLEVGFEKGNIKKFALASGRLKG